MKRGSWLVALIVAATFSGGVLALAPRAHAVPAPEVEYLGDITVRRQYSFANAADAINYAHGICDKISNGASYTQVMGDVKSGVRPNDECAANYLVSYAVNIFCPAQLWQLRDSAANYLPPPANER
ncbi:DUF732 domain-containing protein [Mycobacterium heckeshornense]|uniref:Uncharacterized protein n=1 Tax=Mycobacterium heckeshornense TaxID=110505 RepID=A0A2I3EHR6_9MYCO|nr:DUF732 domain-containing protein [Mycobacterium heckeshornense]KMV15622.1 hypothetical protein ACT16_22745 [Mycobacterium heckeshornense]MCV7036248.1 DUF732 domain-containing protein [Mycobacterium heckeshornense]BCO36239.1 hypothetical protein MHEC_26720 [Mycobacterium heckeshornense]